MKHIAVVFLVAFFFTLVEASTYKYKSIRVGSFAKKENAQRALVSLKEYIKTQPEILKYQKNMAFRAKVVKVGKYYMNVIEPFYKDEKNQIEAVIKIIKKRYSYAYIRKIKESENSTKKQPLPKKTVVKKIAVKETLPPKKEEVINDVNIVVTEVENAVVELNKTQKVAMQEAVQKLHDNKDLDEVQDNLIIDDEDIVVDDDLAIEEDTLTNKAEDDIVEEKNDTLLYDSDNDDEKLNEESSSQKDLTRSIVNKDFSSEYSQADSIKNEMLWKMLFFIALIIIIILFVRIYLSKKNIIKQVQSSIIAEEKIKQKQEEKLSRDKFISHISHELRTPMTSILGLTHLVLEDNLSHSQRENIQKIESSGQHMLSILNDILDASKIEAGEFKVQNNEFNINDTVEYVLNIMAIQAQNNNDEITITVAKDVPSVLHGDSLRLGQILINIISNAIKYTKDGTIDVIIKKLSSNGNIVTLSFKIKDSGVGMSATEIENVFRPYTQATSADGTEFSGTGLGLSISKQLIEKMGGEINVTSKLGKGTTFSFNINFKVKDIKNRRKYRLPSTKFLNKSILIIDEGSEDTLQLIESLGYFKYRIKVIEKLSSENFDQHSDIVMIKSKLLTSDVVNDLVIMKSLNNNLKIVVIDDLENGFDEVYANSLEIDSYLQKPYTKQAILNLIIDLYVSKKVDKLQRNKAAKEKLSKFAGKKILVAEDNEVNHKVIAGFLAGTGINLEFVADGRLAFEYFREHQDIDLILMDINMPMMNGYEATQEIRILEEEFGKEHTPILALTADIMDDAILKALSSGMQGYISKPIVVDKFYKTIYEFLNVERETQKLLLEKEPTKKKEKEQITELSVSAGIKRCADDESFYNSMLEEFKNEFATSDKKIEQLCLDGEFEKAKDVAEEVRDFAVNVGAYNLAEGLETLEYELDKGEKGNWKKLVSFYSNLLDKLLKDIEKQIL